MTSDDQFPRLTDCLDASARQIDLIFAEAGEKLGEGLILFDALKQQLSVLSGELAGPEMAGAGAALTDLVADLRRLSRELTDETQALSALASHSSTASEVLENLLTHMRLITILARLARIESGSVQSKNGDLGDFTREILALTDAAQGAVADCARDHHRLSAMLGTALGVQREFESRYGEALTTLAGKLERTLAEVSMRQQRSLALTQDAAAHSGKIAMAAGNAVISLQSGDSIRQRLEHAIAGLRLTASLREGTGVASELESPDREVVERFLQLLQAAHLRECATALGADYEVIEHALTLLAGDTTALIALVLSLYTGDSAGSASFVADLEPELVEASVLLRKCDIARAGVDRVTAAFADVLSACQSAVGQLGDTVSNIVLIGLNTGLRAARLGDEGRGLVVVAKELKVAASAISADAARLGPTFDSMQTAAAALARVDRLDAARFAQLENTMQSSLHTLRGAGARLGEALDRLDAEGHSFSAIVERARLSFSNVGAISDLIASTADHLGHDQVSLAPHERAEAAERVRSFLQAHVWPSYTMAAERNLHLAVLAEHGLAAEAGPAGDAPVPGEAAAQSGTEADELDEFLF
jgi:hypothetical protein